MASPLSGASAPQAPHPAELVVDGIVRGEIVQDPNDPDVFGRFSAAQKHLRSLPSDPSQQEGSLSCAMAISLAQATKPSTSQRQPPPLPAAAVIDSQFPRLVGKHLSDFDNVTLKQVNPDGSMQNTDLHGLAKCIIAVMPGPTYNTPLPTGWMDIPGAAGCGGHAQGFSDAVDEFKRHDVAVYVLTTQNPGEQIRVSAAKEFKVPMLSDPAAEVGLSLGLPKFVVDGQSFYPRGDIIVGAEGEVTEVRDQFLAYNSEPDSTGAHVNPAADADDILAGLAKLTVS